MDDGPEYFQRCPVSGCAHLFGVRAASSISAYPVILSSSCPSAATEQKDSLGKIILPPTIGEGFAMEKIILAAVIIFVSTTAHALTITLNSDVLGGRGDFLARLRGVDRELPLLGRIGATSHGCARFRTAQHSAGRSSRRITRPSVPELVREAALPDGLAGGIEVHGLDSVAALVVAVSAATHRTTVCVGGGPLAGPTLLVIPVSPCAEPR